MVLTKFINWYSGFIGNIFLNVSGKIDIGFLKGYGNFKSTSGKIQLNEFEIIGNTNIESVSGKIQLFMFNNLGYNINYNTTSGRVNINNYNNTLNDSNNFTLNLKTVSGKIEVN